MKGQALTVYLTGDAGILREFAECCRTGGFQVAAKTNDRSRLPSGIRRRPKPEPSSAFAAELTIVETEQKRSNLRMLDRSLPAKTLILSSCCTISAAEQSSWMKHPDRLVGISAFPTLLRNHMIEGSLAPATRRELLTTAQEFLLKMGKKMTVIQDRAGMVMPRVLCQIINEAFFALTEGIASPPDIDRAMKLGTGYPAGPVEWAERIGIREVVAVLEGLVREYGEDRYRTAPLLRQLAFARGSRG
ncbi:MAG TPA: 3-hydroxyacyl-CoA dehydrogenase family protein [Bacteroidota bacterium]|nr:3-hydroxyacyl-CoA dehydrogenase family protein [Bacteroidota bacterium]